MNKRETIDAAQRGDGCLGHAADDEPVFVLRGKDLLSGETVRFWADCAERRHHNAGTLHKAQKEKIDDARKTAAAMDAWPARKLPD